MTKADNAHLLPYNAVVCGGTNNSFALEGEEVLALSKSLGLETSLIRNIHPIQNASDCAGWCVECIVSVNCYAGCLECVGLVQGCSGSIVGKPPCKPAVYVR